MSFDPSVQVIQEWIVDHAQHWTFLVDQPERDGDERETMDKVGCPWLHVRSAAAANEM